MNSKKNIRVFEPVFRTKEILDEMKKALDIGWSGMGFKTIEFEDAWSDYTGYRNCHFLNSNTSGLNLSLQIFKEEYGWSSDDEIISTPLTFISTNHAILHNNLKPVFADVNSTLCLDYQNVKDKINSKTKAVMYVGLGGNAGDYNKIRELCDKHKIKLILDAAHMAGSREKGVHLGLDADCSIYSFQAVKNLPTADSGMICFKEKEFDNKVRQSSWLGIDKDTYNRSDSMNRYKWKYDVTSIGHKYHGNSIIAAMGLVGLKYLDEDNQFRRSLYSKYYDHLKSCSKVKLVEHTNHSETSQHLIQIVISNRDELIQKLSENNIYVGVHYANNLDYKMYHKFDKDCDYSKKMSNSIISLPCHLNINQSDIDYICEVVTKYAK